MNKNTCPIAYEALMEKYCAVCKERDVQQYVEQLKEECRHD